MEAPKSNLALVFAIALAAMIVTALAASQLALQKIPSSGSVKTLRVAVFQDAECKQNLTFIDWGLVEAGKGYQRVIWIKNIGNTPVKLNMTTESWSPPEAKAHITLSWDRERLVLNGGQAVNATLRLDVSTSVAQTNIMEFSFTIVITGAESS
ncbi:MAG: hypothetical protein QXJ07_01805 [Candidatus Bathyarchaeia archaeon]